MATATAARPRQLDTASSKKISANGTSNPTATTTTTTTIGADVTATSRPVDGGDNANPGQIELAKKMKHKAKSTARAKNTMAVIASYTGGSSTAAIGNAKVKRPSVWTQGVGGSLGQNSKVAAHIAKNSKGFVIKGKGKKVVMLMTEIREFTQKTTTQGAASGGAQPGAPEPSSASGAGNKPKVERVTVKGIVLEIARDPLEKVPEGSNSAVSIPTKSNFWWSGDIKKTEFDDRRDILDDVQRVICCLDKQRRDTEKRVLSNKEKLHTPDGGWNPALCIVPEFLQNANVSPDLRGDLEECWLGWIPFYEPNQEKRKDGTVWVAPINSHYIEMPSSAAGLEEKVRTALKDQRVANCVVELIIANRRSMDSANTQQIKVGETIYVKVNKSPCLRTNAIVEVNNVTATAKITPSHLKFMEQDLERPIPFIPRFDMIGEVSVDKAPSPENLLTTRCINVVRLSTHQYDVWLKPLDKIVEERGMDLTRANAKRLTDPKFDLKVPISMSFAPISNLLDLLERSDEGSYVTLKNGIVEPPDSPWVQVRQSPEKNRIQATLSVVGYRWTGGPVVVIIDKAKEARRQSRLDDRQARNLADGIMSQDMESNADYSEDEEGDGVSIEKAREEADKIASLISERSSTAEDDPNRGKYEYRIYYERLQLISGRFKVYADALMFLGIDVNDTVNYSSLAPRLFEKMRGIMDCKVNYFSSRDIFLYKPDIYKVTPTEEEVSFVLNNRLVDSVTNANYMCFDNVIDFTTGLQYALDYAETISVYEGVANTFVPEYAEVIKQIGAHVSKAVADEFLKNPKRPAVATFPPPVDVGVFLHAPELPKVVDRRAWAAISLLPDNPDDYQYYLVYNNGDEGKYPELSPQLTPESSDVIYGKGFDKLDPTGRSKALEAKGFKAGLADWASQVSNTNAFLFCVHNDYLKRTESGVQKLLAMLPKSMNMTAEVEDMDEVDEVEMTGGEVPAPVVAHGEPAGTSSPKPQDVPVTAATTTTKPNSDNDVVMSEAGEGSHPQPPLAKEEKKKPAKSQKQDDDGEGEREDASNSKHQSNSKKRKERPTPDEENEGEGSDEPPSSSSKGSSRSQRHESESSGKRTKRG